MGVAVCCGLSSNVEAPTDLGAPADDGALAGQGDEAFAVELFDFREIGQKGPSGDFAHALVGLDELFAVLEAVFLTGELLDEVPPTIEKGGELGAGLGGGFHGA